MTGVGSVFRLVVFRLDGQRYALPLAVVERALPMLAIVPLPQAPAVALGVINLHGAADYVLPPDQIGALIRAVVARE